MSFSFDQKTALIGETVKNSCCRRALLHGVLAAKGTVDGSTVSVRVDGRDVAAFIGGLITEFYGREPYIGPSPSGGRGVTISFESGAAEKYLTAILSDGEISTPEKCQGCKPAFLRGLFLAAGRLSDPMTQYSLEFSLGDRAPLVLSFLESVGVYPKISYRKNETLLYLKNSALIEDFFALAMMNQTTFALMNAKIESEIRNSVNRVSNCETNNIEKSVGASAKQVAAIERLARAGLLSSLPEELELSARQRLEFPDLSLTQLAATHTPPITKSGLSHRMNRLVALADELLGKA